MSPEASCAYNEPFKLELQGPLELSFLKQALRSVLGRHEAFNLRFSPSGDYQQLATAQEIALPLTDLSALGDDAQTAALEAAFTAAGSTPFDLVNGPLTRIQLFKLAPDHHLLLFATHHIICDGWSWNLLLQEIGRVYSALQQQTTYQHGRAIPYRQYVLHEVAQQTDPAIEQSYQFWLDQFAELPPVLELPTDRPRPPVKRYHGRTVTHHFEAEVYGAIKKVAAEQRVSLFTLLFASFNLLLTRLSNQNDIVMTIPSAGQLAVGAKGLVGHCVNLLPIRSTIDPQSSFKQLLQQTSGRVLDAYEHQACTLGGIIKRLQMSRDASRTPLVEINFNLDRDEAGVSFAGLTTTITQTPKQAAVFDLFFNLNETANGLMVDCDYNSDLFDETTIKRWIHYYETLLIGIAQKPHGRLADLPLMPSQELHKLLNEWNNTTAAYPDQTVTQLFEQQAADTPHATAVECGAKTLTFAELNQQANQLAHHLQTVGIGRGSLVGISLTRSEQMLISLLAVLKTGGTYVPMDPAYPASRLAHMAEDAQLVLVLTESQLRDELPLAAVPMLCVDQEWPQISQQPTTNLNVPFDPEQLAYVIYTSGSTGKPKGVQIPHRALTNFLCAMQKTPRLTAADTIINVTTLSFDIAALELYLPLITGARLILIPQETAADGFALAHLLAEKAITVMQATPTTWQMLLEAGWHGQPNLKMLCGGERLPQPLARQLLATGGELWNMYGPTETTIWSSVAQVTAEDDTITIGGPIDNTQLYVLDDYLQPLPVGSVGTLYIGGDGLAQGYLNQPELTAKRFVAHPFGNGRIYNTGDRARYGADGRVECLGRVDYQVKIRGFRIELGEVEAALSQHPAVQSCVAVVREDHPGDKRLAAYIIVNRGYTPTEPELRDHIRTQLPEYMIPANFMLLEEFPLTPNGKINRLELPSPQPTTHQAPIKNIAPRTENEKAIAQIWAEILRVPQVNVHDNFFELGGHSLLAVRVINRIREVYEIELSMTTLFEAPTLATLCQRLEALLHVRQSAARAGDDDEREAFEF